MVLSRSHDQNSTKALFYYQLSCAPHCPEILDCSLALIPWRQTRAIAVECALKATAWKIWHKRRELADVAAQQRLASGMIAFVRQKPFTSFFKAEQLMSSQLLSLPEDGFRFMQRARDVGMSWAGVDVKLNRLMYCDDKIIITTGREVMEMMTVAQDLNAVWEPEPLKALMQRLNGAMDGVLRHEVYQALTWVQDEAGTWLRQPQYYQAKEMRLLAMFGDRLFRFTLGVEKIDPPRSQSST